MRGTSSTAAASWLGFSRACSKNTGPVLVVACAPTSVSTGESLPSPIPDPGARPRASTTGLRMPGLHGPGSRAGAQAHVQSWGLLLQPTLTTAQQQRCQGAKPKELTMSQVSLWVSASRVRPSCVPSQPCRTGSPSNPAAPNIARRSTAHLLRPQSQVGRCIFAALARL